MDELLQAGASGFTDDGIPIMDEYEVFNAVLDIDDFTHKAKEIFTVNFIGEKSNG